MKRKDIWSVWSVLITFLILATFIGAASAETTNWGGISSPNDIPPNGTTINVNLTTYYNTPTATGNGFTYWYIGGFWFNQTEMINLPVCSVQYRESPYACDSGGHSGGQPVIPVPVNPLVIIGFVGVVGFVVWRRKK